MLASKKKKKSQSADLQCAATATLCFIQTEKTPVILTLSISYTTGTE